MTEIKMFINEKNPVILEVNDSGGYISITPNRVAIGDRDYPDILNCGIINYNIEFKCFFEDGKKVDSKGLIPDNFDLNKLRDVFYKLESCSISIGNQYFFNLIFQSIQFDSEWLQIKGITRKIYEIEEVECESTC